MKQIIAIIRMSKINETKEALNEVGLPSFMASGKVQGRGKGRGNYLEQADLISDDKEYMSLSTGEPRLKTKRLLHIYVADEKADLAVETIIKANRTDKSGDGKIFILPAVEAYRVRTGESGESVLD
jgi:nitrogen regulatory protein PII 2